MLPEIFLKEMQNELKDEFNEYLDCFNKPSYKGLRVNTNKISIDEFLTIFPYQLESIPWTNDGFYYFDDEVTKHPYYYAGLYYIQEPSAMLPAETLMIEEDDLVLDACSAPGGKSTKLAIKLNNTGTLISNDISYSRQLATLKNIERFGLKNVVVTAANLNELVNKYANSFDKILLDAPCSGEGMFRKDSSLIKSWEKKNSDYYAPIQKELITSAIKLLKYGGQLVYSTCTFNKNEDEEIIKYALSIDKELRVIPIKQYDGFTSNEYGTKLYPHKIKGEGHFVSLIQKGEKIIKKPTNKLIPIKPEYLNDYKLNFNNGYFTKINDFEYYSNNINTDGIRVLSSGLRLGQIKNNEFEPSQQLAFALSNDDYPNTINLSIDDQRVLKYLKGETISLDDAKEGYNLITVNNYPLGFIKKTNGIIKNKIDKGWVLR